MAGTSFRSEQPFKVQSGRKIVLVSGFVDGNVNGKSKQLVMSQYQQTDTSVVREAPYSLQSALAARLDGIQEHADFTGREVAQLLGTSPETISRWRGGKSEPQPKLRDGLLQLEWLVSELAELYPPKEAHLWLFSPHKLLKGERPVDLISRGETDSVLQIIAQLKDGAYT